MGRRITGVVFLVISIVAIGAAAIRVVTASDRVKDRRDTARRVCAETGGKWVRIDRDEICQRAGDVARRGS